MDRRYVLSRRRWRVKVVPEVAPNEFMTQNFGFLAQTRRAVARGLLRTSFADKAFASVFDGVLIFSGD